MDAGQEALGPAGPDSPFLPGRSRVTCWGGSGAGAEPGAPSAEGAARPACPGSGLLPAPTAGTTPSPLATMRILNQNSHGPRGTSGSWAVSVGTGHRYESASGQKTGPRTYTENLILKETNAHVRAHSSRSPSMEGIRSRWKTPCPGASLAKNGATRPTATLQGVRTRKTIVLFSVRIKDGRNSTVFSLEGQGGQWLSLHPAPHL